MQKIIEIEGRQVVIETKWIEINGKQIQCVGKVCVNQSGFTDEYPRTSTMTANADSDASYLSASFRVTPTSETMMTNEDKR